MSDVTGSQRERYDKTIRRRDKLASFLYDLAKACFTLMVIAGIGIFYTDGLTLYVIMSVLMGFLLTVILAWIANRVLIF